MLVNLTPHPISFEGGPTLPECDVPPRLGERALPLGKIESIPVVEKSFDLDGCTLPPEINGTYYVVSLLVAQAFRGKRDDLLVTNDPIRDAAGRITGCRSLAKL